jgi:hypothetical protein
MTLVAATIALLAGFAALAVGDQSVRAGTYKVCDDLRDPTQPKSVHLRVGDLVTIGPSGAAREIVLGSKIVSAIENNNQLSSVVEFVHYENGKAVNAKHLVRITQDPGYSGTACTGPVLAINFCPLSKDGVWRCPPLKCEVQGACHGGDVHAQPP